MKHCKGTFTAKVTTWLTTAFVEWNALLTILAPGAWLDFVSVTMPLLSIKDLAVAIFHQSGTC